MTKRDPRVRFLRFLLDLGSLFLIVGVLFVTVSVKQGGPQDPTMIGILAAGVALWIAGIAYAVHLHKVEELRGQAATPATHLPLADVPPPTRDQSDASPPKDDLVRLMLEHREKREELIASSLESHLKEAELQRVDDEYAPKLEAAYAKL